MNTDNSKNMQSGVSAHPPATSLGQYRVGITFNPGGHQAVNSIKSQAAGMIDFLERWKDDNPDAPSEALRLIALAQTHIEDAAMWAVKAVTKPAR